MQIKKILNFVVICFVGLVSCYFPGRKDEKLKFNPASNTIYHFTLEKFSATSWTYQSRPMKIFDTVYLDFSLQQNQQNDSLISCKLTFNRFQWKGRSKVNYKRNSADALKIDVLVNDSGQVENVSNVDFLLKDIESDSATGKYLNGVIPDHISVSAITDMLNRIFSVIPARIAKVNDTWITDIILITNHPVHISNYNVLKSRNGDSAMIDIQSHFFERRSPGDESYINGNAKGIALVNYSTGMPYLYKTQSDVVTTTSYYDIRRTENFILRRDSVIKLLKNTKQ